MEQCENCGRTIGRLETAHVYRDHVVCAGCLAVLTPPPAAVIPPVRSTRSSPGLSTRGRRRQFVDYLLVPRMVFLGLFLLTSFMAIGQENPDRTLQWVFLGCWLLLGLAKLVMKAAHRASNE